MNNKIIAYLPTINQRHLDWFRKVKPHTIYVISNDVAKSFLPRLERNMSSVDTGDMVAMLNSLGVADFVLPFDPQSGFPKIEDIHLHCWYLPDEDISHLVYGKYFEPLLVSAKELFISFDSIWARWDMLAVHASQPVIPDVSISQSTFDNEMLVTAYKQSGRSPDWWRQVGAVLLPTAGEITVVSACNTHLPNEYEVYIFGDPRLYANAGEKGKSCAMHAERAVIAQCAKIGISTNKASIYVTTFPCEDCAREIVTAGISKVFFREGYSVLNALDVLRSNRVLVVQVLKNPASA